MLSCSMPHSRLSTVPDDLYCASVAGYCDASHYYTKRKHDFDGYGEIMASLTIGPLVNQPKEEFPDAYPRVAGRMRGFEQVPATQANLEKAYQQVVKLESYFSKHPRVFEVAELGNDDVILLEASPAVGCLQAILQRRRVASRDGMRSYVKDLRLLSRKFGYTLVIALWMPDDVSFGKESPDGERTVALKHWLKNGGER